MSVSFSVGNLEECWTQASAIVFLHQCSFQELIYKLYALAYIPTDDLYEVYKEQIVSIITRKLAEKTGDPEWQVLEEEINQFGTYFLNTWIGRQVCTFKCSLIIEIDLLQLNKKRIEVVSCLFL